ncbi:kelch-like protein 17 [Penaeus vannamei]|uniref:kelch-like protein 17 n=1 Tax=Penaeus vannamei TaxID=6689 RepID=UPI00387FA884
MEDFQLKESQVSSQQQVPPGHPMARNELLGIWMSYMMDKDSCLYALGGFDSTNYQCTVERLDPRVGKWMSVPPMMSRRSSCGAAILGGMLYCVGGNDGTMCMASAERFNPRRNTWEPITAMHSRRSTHEVVEIDGFLYALGGNDGSSSLNSMERYDAKLNKWVLVTSMLARRSSVGAAVLDCLQLEKGLNKST